jgi:predicted DNA-binding transcriptional regulator AlpA
VVALGSHLSETENLDRNNRWPIGPRFFCVEATGKMDQQKADNRKVPDYVRTRAETCKILGVSRSTLRRWERSGEAPPRVRLTNKIAGYTDSAIAAFIHMRTQS